MPPEQIQVVVRKPLSDIEDEIRRKYRVQGGLADVAIEQDALVLTFQGIPQNSASKTVPPSTNSTSNSAEKVSVRRRRKHRVRNRMKTRGWDVVAKFVNSRGQTCTIYRPFYDALASQKLKRREAYSIVRDVLVSNGNSPRPASIDYFLSNTLEYIHRQSLGSKGATADTPAEAISRG